MKFTRISTPKKSKKKSKKRSKKSEAADEDFETQTRQVIEILGSPVSGILFSETTDTTFGSDNAKRRFT